MRENKTDGANERLFLQYLKYRRGYIVGIAVCAGIFCLFSWLCAMPPDMIVYALILLGSAGAVAATVGYVKFCRKHAYLRSLLARVGTSMEGVTEYATLIDSDYHDVIMALDAALARAISDSDQRESDMRDYYSLWAHQIKTPIAAMRLLLQSEKPACAEELSAELFRIEQYVEMVMQYVRTQSGQTDYVVEQCDLDRIVKAAVRKYAQSFIRKKIALCYEPLEVTVLTDRKWLGFAVEQVLSNALKYTRSGSVTVTFENGELIISDTGIGIRPEDLPRVFDNTFTGYNGREDRKSTGIGLYLTRRILTSLGHTVSITSELGRGTRVAIGLGREKLGVE